MLREEAIRILRAYIWKGELDEARNMAIKALDQEPTTKNDCAEQNGCITCSLDDGDDCCRKLYEQNMQETTKNDLGVDAVSRQAAIDAIRRIHPIDTDYDCTLLDKADVMYVLNDLPSVTPQEPVKKLEKQIKQLQNRCHALTHGQICVFCPYECEHKAEVRDKE